MNKKDIIRHNILILLLIIGLYVTLYDYLPPSIILKLGRNGNRIVRYYKYEYILNHVLLSAAALIWSIWGKDMTNITMISVCSNVFISVTYFCAILGAVFSY